MNLSNFKKWTKRAFPALTHKNFRLFFMGQSISQIGTWMQSIGQSWLVLQLTNDVFKLGLLTATQFLPVMILSLFGGTLADRLPQKKILLFSQSTLGILAAILSVLTVTHVVQYWMVLIIAFFLGVTNAIDMPARQSFFIKLVGKEHLSNAIMLNSTSFNLARLIGPAIAAGTIAWLGIASCFYINALSFVAVILGLIMIKTETNETNQKTISKINFRQTLHDIVEGVQYIIHEPELYLPLLNILGISTFIMNYNVIFPEFSKTVLNTGVNGLSSLTTTMGVGSVIAATTLAITTKGSPKTWMLTFSSIGLSIVFVILGFMRHLTGACVFAFLAGIGNIILTSSTNSTLQINSKSELRGRVIGVYSLVMGGTTPIGSLFTGAVASKIGIAPSISLIGFICLVLSILSSVMMISHNKKK